MNRIKFFELSISDNIKEQIIKEAGGIQLRIPKAISKHNPIYVKKRNKEIINRFLELKYSNTAIIKQLAKEFNLNSITIRRIFETDEIAGDEMKKFTKKDLEVRDELIKLCLKKGISKRKTAEIFGISRQWLYKIINE